MKEWWNNLSLRDKRIVFFGGIIVIITLLYFFILQPLSDKNAMLRTQIEHNKQLLAWMKAANKQIAVLQKKSTNISTPHSNASALSIVQNEIKQSSLAGKFTQLKQAEDDSVQLNFQAVNFDELIVWLTDLWQTHGLIVTQAAIDPTGTAGIVSAEMTLKNG